VSDPLTLHPRALDGFGRRVRAIAPDQWGNPTPCTEWNVRDLVAHLVSEQRWAPPLLAGQTPADVGDRFTGDVLGENPARAWDEAAAGSRKAFAEKGALQRTVTVSYGETSAEHYLFEMIADLVVHAWDLARGIGGEEALDPELVRVVHGRTAPHADQLAASGLFDPPIPVEAGADEQTKLLALFGRRA
jgi:uncharacterized protein (TIGR03086 family)